MIYLMTSSLAVASLIVLAFTISGIAKHSYTIIFKSLFLSASVFGPVSVLLSNRNINIDVLHGEVPEPATTLAGKILLACVLLLSAAQFLAFAIYRLEGSRSLQSNSTRTLLTATLFGTFIFYFLAYSIAPIIFGRVFFFQPSLLYPLIFYSALFVWFPRSPYVAAASVPKLSLLACLIVTLFGAILKPSVVFESHYASLVPGIAFRLWGATGHANTLGAMAAGLLVLQIASGWKDSRANWWTVIFAVTGLLLSQSKTSIGAAAAGALTIWGCRRVAVASVMRSARGDLKLLLSFFGTLAILAALIFCLSTIGFFGRIDTSRLAVAGLDVRTATGRTLIWQAGLKGGLESPEFGYGASFWSLQNRLRIGLTGAVDAHNLYLQTFARSGSFGLVALIVFLFVLTHAAFAVRKVTRSGSIGLLVMLLIRSIFEVAIQPNSLFGSDLYVVLSIIFYIAGSQSENNLFPMIPKLKDVHD